MPGEASPALEVFETRDHAATVETMTPDSYVNHIPVATGGRGTDEMMAFYGTHFIPKMSADNALRQFCRTIGQGRVVDEFVFTFTHDAEMDWMLPGVALTGRPVEIPMVVVFQFAGDKIECERIYWEQASVLVQLVLLDRDGLPVPGLE